MIIDNQNGETANGGTLDITKKEKTVITRKNFDNIFIDFSVENPTTVSYYILSLIVRL